MEQKKILVIEDNEASLELMTYLLKAYGYNPIIAKNGKAGVTAALAEMPDLVICDIHMPDMDGLTVVATLKRRTEFQGIPIIAVTALAMVGDKEKFLAAGFDGYLSKPIDPVEFVGYIKPFLSE